MEEEISENRRNEALEEFRPFAQDGEPDADALESLSGYTEKPLCCDAVRAAMAALKFGTISPKNSSPA